MNINIKKYMRASAARFPLTIKLHNLKSQSLRKFFDLSMIPFGLIYAVLMEIFCKKNSEKTIYQLGIATIIKNEADYIEEWIAYHRVFGFERFYIYDNDSTDNIENVLSPYIKAGIVVYKKMPGIRRQYDAYNDVINKYKNECKFIAFLDLDEFIYGEDLNLIKFCEKNDNEKTGGISLNWLIFGSAGHKSKPDGFVTENYLYRSEYNFEKNYHLKTIVNPRKVLGFINPHYAVFMSKYSSVNSLGDYCYGPFSKTNENMPYVVCHYFTKSKAEFELKRSRGKADSLTIRAVQEFEEHDKNDIYDDRMLKLKERIKNMML